MARAGVWSSIGRADLIAFAASVALLKMVAESEESILRLCSGLFEDKVVKKMKAFKEIGFGLLTLGIGIDGKVQSLFKILMDALFPP